MQELLKESVCTYICTVVVHILAVMYADVITPLIRVGNVWTAGGS